jgi:hypothetical protein
VPAATLTDPSQRHGPLAWHLAECKNTADAAAHCAEGQRLIAAGSDPDGHCLVEGRCPRCAGG